MTVLTNKADIRRARESGKIIKEVFRKAGRMIREGVSTAHIDREIEKMIRKRGGTPAFKGYKGYPAVICASVNEVVVHGIPSEDIILRKGDIVSIDVGVEKNGFYADAAKTFAVGRISKAARKLIDVTKASLDTGIRKAISGNRVSDISNAIQAEIEKAGYQEVRTFVGHGIGRQLHESPEVPNWGEKGKGPRLRKGLLLAIEPMANEGTREVDVLSDGWTAVTRDRKLSAHFEHTVMVGEKGAEILT
jgi:methionyl aminopeptidase